MWKRSLVAKSRRKENNCQRIWEMGRRVYPGFLGFFKDVKILLCLLTKRKKKSSITQ